MNQQILAGKKDVVAQLTETIKNSKTTVAVSYSAMSVAEVNTLRAALKKDGAKLTVHKNSLTKKAAAEDGLSELTGLLKGQTALVVSQEAGAGLVTLSDFAKAHSKNFEIKGGFIDGAFCNAAQVADLANIGGKDGALARLLSVMEAPLVQFALTIKAVGEKNDPEGAKAFAD